jgi:protein TonB
MGKSVAIFCAVLVHLGFLLFGGLLFPSKEENAGTIREVELLSETEAEAQKEKEPEETPQESEEELRSEDEQPPDATELLRSLDVAPVMDAPALDAASLSALEQALSGAAGAGDFGDALSFASGGRIGGTGDAGALEAKLEDAFSLTEIDQKPRVLFQTSPSHPQEMRGKKLEGLVTVTFVVNANGKVERAKVETSNHPAFEKPALAAVKQWTFEPALRSGQRVSCKMRVRIRFPANGGKP